MGKRTLDTEKLARTDTGSPRGQWLWQQLCRGMGAVYTAVGRAFPGRILTAYRKVEASMAGSHRSSAEAACRPVSPARRRVVEAVEQGYFLRAWRALFGALLACPLAVYGLFLLFFSLTYVGSSILRLLFWEQPLSWFRIFVYGTVAVAGILMLITRRSLGRALERSRAVRLLIVGFLCIPIDRVLAPLSGQDNRGAASPKRASVWLFILSALLGVGAAAGTLYGKVAFWLIPVLLPLLLLCALVFAYPEAGVVLSTALLPFVWLDRRAVYVLCALIIVTWCAYGLGLLCLHRAIRFGLLDRVVLILGGYMLLTAGFGLSDSPDTLVLSILPIIILTDYFLIVNLMTTRAYIRRCLVGVAASVVIVTVLAYLSRIPMDALDRIVVTRPDSLLLPAFREVVDSLSGLWQEHAEIYLVLVFPWLFAYLMHTKRISRYMAGVCMLLADLGLILMTRSITATVCVLAVTVLFIILLGPRWSVAGLVSLPVLRVGLWWATRGWHIPDSFAVVLSRSRYFKAQLYDSLWQMVRDHPAGIGIGEDVFGAVYPAYAAPDLEAVTECGNLFFEILIAYGWPGFVLLSAIVFLFLQKGMTALGYTAARRDRAMLIGGIVSLCGMMIFGVFRSFLTVPRVFFTVTLVVSLCSAYANLIFDESDVLTAATADSHTAADRMYRRR